ncbi:MAG: ribonuclease D [Rhodanobacteraceae bacterium]
MSAAWIADATAFSAYLGPLAQGGVIGLDTEFMRRDTFYAKLALIQVAADGRCALVDPLAFDCAEGVRRLVERRTCVMHSASEDMDALAPLLNGEPLQLFDTQIAAAMCGLGFGLSYQRLVALLLETDIPKDETRSDWLRRPLSAAQLDYAEQDVVHLHELHALLHAQLRERGRLEWHAQDCARLARRVRRDQGDPQPQRAFRNGATWPRAKQALLRRILLWRERSARSLDKPRSWLLDDPALLSLAQQPPGSSNELFERTRGLRALRSAPRAELFALLSEPVADAEIGETAPIPPAPFGEAKAAVTAMKLAADAIALELDLPAGLLCPRRALEEYVVTRSWPEALAGWRREVLEPTLAPKLPE